MSSRAINIVMVVSLVTFAQVCEADQTADDSKKDCALQVYLPREVTITDNCLRLGQVSLIRGSDNLVARASEIPLGRISVPGQEVVIDRPTVLSRLASNGIPASKVTFAGAETVKVKQQQQTIKGTEFVRLASSFLKENPLAASVCQSEPIWMPQDFAVPGDSNNLQLCPRLVRTYPGNQAKVQIVVLQGGKQIAVREVAFRLKYNCRTAVALVDIPTGAVINSENVKIENTVSNYPEPADWKPPYGLIAKRHLLANTVLAAYMVGPASQPVIVGRNQNVIIRIERPGLLVTAIGKTLEDGRTGECIKVRNADSQRIILVRVNEDGTVEPVL